MDEVRLGIEINFNKTLSLSFLVDDEFCISFEILNLRKALSNFNKLNYKLSAEFENSDVVSVQGLLGTDMIQFMSPINSIDIMNGTAFKLFSGIVPFGNIDSFLYPKQVTPVKTINSLSYQTIINKYSSANETQLNFALNPKTSYPDLLSEQIVESQVERKLEKMFDLDSFGENN